ncbi:hypothetical protein PEC302110_15680 [Pectobacterium araliae]|uniref:Uncharacterized protein n=1 Tax=Pectobacterium araliae TaxID=3073862 RepID=A0AAN0K9Z2_9GAMM|nr:hypothetical protein PEC302110_15680 [Pectobacterium sp. MAFF 302110]
MAGDGEITVKTVAELMSQTVGHNESFLFCNTYGCYPNVEIISFEDFICHFIVMIFIAVCWNINNKRGLE